MSSTREYVQRDRGRRSWTGRSGLRAWTWLAAVPLVGWVCSGAIADPPTASQLYKSRCANCHGASGKNPRLLFVFPDLPDLTNAKWQAAHTKSQLADVILHGKGAMPAFKGDLEGLRASQVVDFLRTFAHSAKAGSAKGAGASGKKDPPAGDPPSAAKADPPTAAEVYQKRCANCHGAGGKNPRLHFVFPDLPDLTNAKWQAAHTKSQLADVILHGKGAMPAFKGDLEGVRTGQIVQYLREFAKPAAKP